MAVRHETHLRPKCYVPVVVQKAVRHANGYWTVWLEIPEGEEGFVEVRGKRKIMLTGVVFKIPGLVQGGRRARRKKLKRKVSDGTTEYPGIPNGRTLGEPDEHGESRKE